MEWIKSYLIFTSNNIYGFIPILVVVFLIFFILKLIFKNFPNPFIFVFISFIILIFTLPSVPRYIFETEILSEYENASEFKLVNSTRWGAFTEPITLIKTPIGFFHFVNPVSQIPIGYDKNRSRNEFLSQIHRYNEEPIYEIVDVECSDKLISYSRSFDGIYRSISFNEKMLENEYKIYCETNYEKEAKTFFCKANILMKMDNITEEIVSEVNKQCINENK